MKNLSYCRKNVRDEERLIATFDTETEGLGGKILALSYSSFLGSDIFLGEPEEILAKWFDKFFEMPLPFIHYAHNLQYDLRQILPPLLKLEGAEFVFGMRTDTDIYRVQVKYNGKKYEMRDSFALYPQSLKEFSKNFSKNEKQSIGLESGITFDVHNLIHIEYAIQDAIILRECLCNFDESIYKLFGVHFGHTTAGTAIKAWQYTLDNEKIDYSIDGDKENFIRSAYFGGLVFLTDNKKHFNCKTFDINSSYPAVMENYFFPVGAPIKTDTINQTHIGIYHIEIETPPDLKIPIIPSRDKRGSMRWVSGRFETHVTHAEIDFALMNGHILHRVIRGIYWPEVISPFKNFVEKCRKIRVEFKSTPFETVAKLMQNSAYGKFGARRDHKRIVVGQPEEFVEGVDLIDADLELYAVDEYSEQMACKPEWAVFITAYARLRLLSTAYALGVDNVIYGDTDSITVTDQADLSLIDVGLDYGQFKLEKTWDEFTAIAPKTYAGKLDSGKWIGAVKGVPKKSIETEHYKQIANGEIIDVNYLSLPSLKSSLKRGLKPAKILQRKSTNIHNSQNYCIINDNIKLKTA